MKMNASASLELDKKVPKNCGVGGLGKNTV